MVAVNTVRYHLRLNGDSEKDTFAVSFFYAEAIKNRSSNDIGFGLIVLLTRGEELFQRIRNGTKKIF